MLKTHGFVSDDVKLIADPGTPAKWQVIKSGEPVPNGYRSVGPIA